MKSSFHIVSISRTVCASVMVLVLGLLLSPGAVFAQDGGASGISIKPTIFEDSLDPGDTYNSIVKVSNLTDTPQTYYASVRDVINITEGGRPLFADYGEVTEFGIADWVTVPEGPIEIAAGATIEVPFTVDVPMNASPGSHIGGIFIGPKAERPEELGTGVGYQLVPIVSIQISGDLIEDADIRAFSTKKLFYGKPEVSFTVTVENKGNVAIRARGPIEIKSMFGKKIGSIMVNENAGLIPPRTVRTYTVDWVGEDEVFFGRFVANVTLGYGQFGVKSMLRSISFWILPMNIILPILIGFTIFVLSIYGMVRVYIRKHIRAIEQSTGRSIKNMPHQQEPLSRLAFIAILLLVFTIIFMMILFLFFA
jgi:hypothetical protein